MSLIAISDRAYQDFTQLISDEIGITLSEQKKTLIESRLFKRMSLHNIDSFEAYYQVCIEDPREKIEMLNLITTNETYFFREADHFDFLKKYLMQYEGDTKVRIWSAASSVGAEAYSIAMHCDTHIPFNMWEVIGSDINTHVIKKARMGLFPIEWTQKIPDEYKHKYCLKGKGRYEGEFLIDRQLVKNIRFQSHNLLEPNTSFGHFDIVFLRNVLLYFNNETRIKVIKNVMHNMKQGSFLIISQTENLNGLNIRELEQIHPSIFKVK